MRGSFFWFAVISFVSVTGCKVAPAINVTQPVSDDMAVIASQNAFNGIAAEYPGISATVFEKGKMIWTSSIGFADRTKKTAVTKDTLFNIYSTSKALTGFAFARLIEKGKIRADQTIAQLVPDLPTALHSISVSDILSHRSGIRHYNSPKDWLEFANRKCRHPSDAVAYFKSDPLVHKPGDKETYSTFAFVLASEVLMRVTGANDFETALNNSLGHWADFELDGSSAEKAAMFIDPRILPGARITDSLPDIVPMPPLSAECKFGGGGILASSYQLARAGAAFVGGEIIPKDRIKAGLRSSSKPSSIVYGGAISYKTIEDESILSYQLSGGAPGGRSYLLILFEPEIVVAITGNVDGPNMDKTARQMAKIWFKRNR
ncbi:serine hydrolase [Sphingorhabdus sp. Alg231-15]|uniref:serine hydrolase n=1 Tax=Sphingorhabdus sp. Alg231-15 TaxID=1922222 RepID=UPI000D5514C7